MVEKKTNTSLKSGNSQSNDQILTNNDIKNIDYSSFTHLSNVLIGNIHPYDTYNDDRSKPLSSNYLLSFKVDEELRYFLLNDYWYFYPSLNKKYPVTIGQYLNDEFVNQQNLSEQSTTFNQRNLFILQVDESKELTEMIDYVDIPIYSSIGGAIRVYEDFQPNRYSYKNPKFYEYVHMTILEDYPLAYSDNNYLSIPPYDNEDPSLSSLSVYGTYDIYSNIDRIFNDMKNRYNSGEIGGYGLNPLYTESFELEDTTDYKTIKMEDVDINDFLKIYINYKRESNGIVLYFNYYNYLNTPFVKLENGLLKNDILEGSYLQLEPDQNGYLDIYLQFRYYVSGQLCGYRNIKALTYQIFNISDDKPKFIIRKTDIVNKSKLLRSENTILNLGVEDKIIYINEIDDNFIDFDVLINIGNEYNDEVEFKFNLEFDDNIMMVRNEYNGGLYEMEIRDNVTIIHVKNGNTNQIQIPFRTRFTKNTAYKYNNMSYMLKISRQTVIKANMIKSIKTRSGVITFMTDINTILTDERNNYVVTEISNDQNKEYIRIRQ